MPSNYRYISPDTKRAVVALSLTLKPVEIARLVGIHANTVRNIIKLWSTTGQVTRMNARRGRPRELDNLELAYIEGLIERRPDIYLSEIQTDFEVAFDIWVSERLISRALHRRGYTRKKVTRSGLQPNPESRIYYQALISELYPPETHVYLDESACNRHTSNRNRAWAPIGDRARRHDYFVRGTRYSILPAISLDGVLHLDIIACSWTKEEFQKYIECLLDVMNPYPQRNSVLIMDNASTHHFDRLRELVEARGMRLVYLPAYSPDFNPIEEGFSAMKAWIRRNRDYVLGELTGEETCEPFAMLWGAVLATMTTNSIAGWYRDCGLLV